MHKTDNLIYGEMPFVHVIEKTMRMFLGDCFIIEQLDELNFFKSCKGRGDNRPYDPELKGSVVVDKSTANHGRTVGL